MPEKLTAESQLSEISETIKELEEAMKNENAKRNLADTAEQVYRTFTIL